MSTDPALEFAGATRQPSTPPLPPPTGERGGPSPDAHPFRDEILTPRQLEEHARGLARSHTIAPTSGPARPLLEEFKQAVEDLQAAYAAIARAARAGQDTVPAEEWLLDNFHVVEDQVREIREDLPRGYYLELPRLAAGPSAGYPRVYALALDFIAHTDARLDRENLTGFARAYQEVHPLSIGELWAIPIMLRLGLVENLRRLAQQELRNRAVRERADAWADRLIEQARRRPADTVIAVAELARSPEDRPPVFLVRLIKRLRDEDLPLTAALHWIDELLAESALSTDDLTRQEHHRQAADQVSVGNSITSMRQLAALNWTDFFEQVSLVEQVLRTDPAEAYAAMDPPSRDAYRRRVERLAARSRADEVEVARGAVEQARAAHTDGTDDQRRAHVGYYLVDAGRAALEARIGYRPPLSERLARALRARPSLTYLGTIGLLTLVALLALLAYARPDDAQGVALVVLLLLPCSEVAVSLVNWATGFDLRPRLLPKLLFEQGLPPGCRTMVVVPTLLIGREAVGRLLADLEVRYLANQDDHLHFALLTDFPDAPTEEEPDDAELLRLATDGIAELNARHGQGRDDRFYLFHRRRRWNPLEGAWMGWERKRGKLEEFNRLLRGARDTSFAVQVGDPGILPAVRYVITLDSDTQLPRDVARRLVGTIAHPLHRPRLDPHLGRVTAGYGIVQPRVSTTLASAGRSYFASVFTGNTGIDPYTTAVSDVYQDLFGEGSYYGKAIYDVDAFSAALRDRVPENWLLSHDLFESLFARAALATDVELLDDFPAHYSVYAGRQHRWVRGDWQQAPWILPRVPTAGGAWVRNRLPIIARWKLLDNLRRSLLAPATLALFVAGWTVLPGSPLIWTAVALLALTTPIFAHLTTALIRPDLAAWTSNFRGAWGDLPIKVQQVALTTALLADQSIIMLHAVLRTLVRLCLTRRNLLQWETAAEAERRVAHGLPALWARMWPASALAVLILALVAVVRPASLPLALPFIAVWLVSPAVADRISRPTPPRERRVPGPARPLLRRTARKTWRFFETFVTADEHWLPPDNWQEDPKGVLARRTSPTNIGLYLLSVLAARDFAYLSLADLAERLERTLTTIEGLETYRGHLYNWYDTESLRVLQPAYISTVDSGNLAGHLIALKQGCADVLDQPLVGPRLLLALGDMLQLLRDCAAAVARSEVNLGQTGRLADALDELLAQAQPTPPPDLAGWLALLGELERGAAAVGEAVDQIADRHAGPEVRDMAYWAEALVKLIRGTADELNALAPSPVQQAVEGVPSVRELASRWREGVAVAGSPRPGAARLSLSQGERDGRLNPLPLGEGAEYNEAGEGAPPDALIARFNRLAERAAALVEQMDFRLVYDRGRQLFTIGYNVALGRRDDSYYDLLASEVRLGSLVAIAKGDVPQAHWFRLGRMLVPAAGQRALLSWSGTIFEYLMPLLVMRTYQQTLLDETYTAIVDRQVEYGAARGVPWGISESAYNTLDLALNYQYQAFGVPGLGLKPGLAEDLVVSPYSTLLALPLDPPAAVENLRRLAADGLDGRYGFCEAIDYTKRRVPPGRRSVIVRAYMAHHQGMSLLALDNALHADPMPRRFHAEPAIRATELLLQERVPSLARLVAPAVAEDGAQPPTAEADLGQTERIARLTDPPTAHLLSNGAYTVMLTATGSGYSAFRDRILTRWRSDETLDQHGTFIYLRDLQSGRTWSSGERPTGAEPDDHTYAAVFRPDSVRFQRRDGLVETLTEVAVSPESNAEVRRVTVTNRGETAREIELTSYAEVVLAAAAADVAHPAFGSLFVETEALPTRGALLCSRRPRSATEARLWLVHVTALEGAPSPDHPASHETSRFRFVGRDRDLAAPAALAEGRPLSGSSGAVLDPIVSLRRVVRLAPGARARITFSTAAADSREEALALADKFADPRAVDRTFELAWTDARVELRHLNLSAERMHRFQQLVRPLLYGDRALRPPPGLLARNTKSQPALWPYGLSGDLPIVLVRVDDPTSLGLVEELLLAHEFWRLNALAVDLVLLNEDPGGYLQPLQDQLLALVAASPAHGQLDQSGGVFVRRADLMPDDDRLLLQSVARVALQTSQGPPARQLARRQAAKKVLDSSSMPRASARGPSPDGRAPTSIGPSSSRAGTPTEVGARPSGHQPPDESSGTGRDDRPPDESGGMAVRSPDDLRHFNGRGGFTPDGREYVILLNPGDTTPAPWINVLANPDFGALVTEAGAGYTWSGNSQTNRLTPWSNDPVSDPPGEAIYLRDEASGLVWSPTPLPSPDDQPYRVRHGQGYTVFEHTSQDLEQELTVFVAPDQPLKIQRLRLRNRSAHPRRLSATAYLEWVLGTTRERTAAHVQTELDPSLGALLATCPYADPSGRVAFFATSGPLASATADRTEFLGRGGSRRHPAALHRPGLSGAAGAGLDPCAALQVTLDLAPGQSREVVFVLGQADHPQQARELARRYTDPAQAQQVLEGASARWDELLGTLQVETPDGALDLLLNRWLLYQTLGCRFWARSAFYQSGGAYGFRDQLQDALALLYAAPDQARAQVVRSAARQFLEGDVQHWWHPDTNQGVRTRCSDDLLWLPFVVARYLAVTADATLLDEVVPFIETRPLEPDEHEVFGVPTVSSQSASLYEHCRRALDRAQTRGPHGLPLIGTGDWNDGLNRVGHEGRGESVWVGWFLAATLNAFAPICEARADHEQARAYRAEAARLGAANDAHAWDGAWYRRAYFDDGTPLGSQSNQECTIDAIAQSWAVISAVGDPARARRAMQSLAEHLLRPDDGLILLLTPPFAETGLDPGYIKGYLPGVRENGGQYTHAALWTILATALLGDGDRAFELFSLINPINHALTPQAVERYKVEPYVVAADVYAAPQHLGRGGWTWYTGSAGWMYRLGLETILGFSLQGATFSLDPTIPRAWPGFTLTYRRGPTRYEISVENPRGVSRGVLRVELDGAELPSKRVPIASDGQLHRVRVVLG